MPALYRTIKRLILTEKSSARMAEGEYAFEVDRSATKPQIREAVETLFEVRVKAVRTMIQPSKRKVMGRNVGRRPRWKKAIVRLADGDSIETFEG